jgi:hypothetical protein
MHLISFYNDLLIRYQGKEPLPGEFLLDKMASFYGREYSFGDRWRVTQERVRQSPLGIEVPAYSLTRQRAEKKFRQRIVEIEKDIISDAAQFAAYVSFQMDKE